MRGGKKQLKKPCPALCEAGLFWLQFLNLQTHQSYCGRIKNLPNLNHFTFPSASSYFLPYAESHLSIIFRAMLSSAGMRGSWS